MKTLFLACLSELPIPSKLSKNKFFNLIHISCGQGNWNIVPYNSSSSSSSSSVVVGVAPSTYNYFARKGSVPHNTTTTTSTRKRHMVDDKACKVCGSQSTPLWRRGPDGPQVSFLLI